MPGEPDRDPRIEYQRICERLTKDDARNAAICSDVRQSVRAGRAPLVLTERVDHLEALAGGLRAIGANVVVLRGGMGTKALRAALARATEHVPGQVLLATGRFIGVGFDNARLDTLFLTMPVSWRGTIAQYVGRLHRLHEHKQEVRVYDYADVDIPMLARMLDKRCRGYEAVGYAISLPASAAPGWPAGIPLSADGSWKHQYGASLRRLLRDGVDEPLADLFTQVARQIPAGAQGVERVRSASEAFRFRRLQSLPETRDRFRVNERLPIPFSEDGRMEVDFLDPESKLVLELDGSQHLADREAHRRDRTKIGSAGEPRFTPRRGGGLASRERIMRMTGLGCIVVVAALAFASAAGAQSGEAPAGDGHDGATWGYEGSRGPENWDRLSPAFRLCGLGTMQSPLNIADAVPAHGDPIEFDYGPAPLNIVNNGHTVQVNYAPGSGITVSGRRYELLQFHFHAPSEHSIAGRLAAMEMHLVHGNEAGQLAVVGVLLEIGSENSALREIWAHMPEEKSPERTIDGVLIDAGDLLPTNTSYYRYMGSLTTPPWSEGVSWFVLAEPVAVDRAQLDKLTRTVGANNRPLQARNHRLLLAPDDVRQE
ncbi:MAG: carbonic anhydrase family protein [Thiotrichales bacterium]|nr:carbonic anhydrase family protein [Thiotrichales bacterium]